MMVIPTEYIYVHVGKPYVPTSRSPYFRVPPQNSVLYTLPLLSLSIFYPPHPTTISIAPAPSLSPYFPPPTLLNPPSPIPLPSISLPLSSPPLTFHVEMCFHWMKRCLPEKQSLILGKMQWNFNTMDSFQCPFRLWFGHIYWILLTNLQEPLNY